MLGTVVERKGAGRWASWVKTKYRELFLVSDGKPLGGWHKQQKALALLAGKPASSNQSILLPPPVGGFVQRRLNGLEPS